MLYTYITNTCSSSVKYFMHLHVRMYILRTCISVLGAVMIGLNPASDQKPYNAGLLLAVGGAVL